MPRIATIGCFDGVHLGHVDLFRQLGEIASSLHLQPMICSFREHPIRVLTDVCVPLLTTLDERLERLQQYGDTVLFDFRAIRTLTAEQFMILLREQYQVQALLMGWDHHFGSDGLKQIADYQAIGKQIGMQVIAANVFRKGDVVISSTLIREQIVHHALATANAWLGYDYVLSGEVQHGNGIGASLGFPTANLAIHPDKLLPPSGVYAGEWNGRKVLVNIGTNPTIGNDHITVEVHIPGFEGDLYGQTLSVSLTRFLRPEHRFPSRTALIAQIHEDILLLKS